MPITRPALFDGRLLAARLRAAIPTDCPLCGAAARGGRLCLPCEDAICRRARAHPADGLPWRCRRCALPLSEHDAACPDCAGRDTAFDRTLVAFDYLPPADALVLRMKHGRSPGHADLLGNLLAETVRHASLGLAPDTVLVPIPAGAASLRRRGFNPAGEIARALGRDLGLPVRRDLLQRTRDQPKQSGLGRRSRQQSVQDLYACRGVVRDMRIGLVDDVMTTGSTMHAAAAVLKASGAAEVVALAAGRTPAPAERPAPRRLTPEQTISNDFKTVARANA